MHEVEDGNVVAARELAAGTATIAVTAFGAPVLFPLAEGRVLVISIVTGMLAALVTDWRARTGVTIASVMTLIVFVAPGSLAGDSAPWSYTPLIGFAALLGCGYRWLTHATTPAAGTCPPDFWGGRVEQ
jgi:hypothetical protein